MFRRIEDFERIWWFEQALTYRVLNNLTDASLALPATPDGMMLGQVAWRMVVTLGEAVQQTELLIKAPAPEMPAPTTVEELVNAYRVTSRSFMFQVNSQWDNLYLVKELAMNGEQWLRGFFLYSVLRDHLQLRGQLVALMRQAGLEVPSTSVPTREEWAEFSQHQRRLRRPPRHHFGMRR